MTKNFSKLAILCLLSFVTVIALAQESSNPEKDLAVKLISAQSDEDRDRIFQSNPTLVNVELRKAILEEGDRLQLQSDFPSALKAYHLANQVSKKIGDQEGIGSSLLDIGIIHALQGDNSSALEFYQQSLEIAGKLENKTLLARVLRNIGVAHSDLGNTSQAIEYFQKSLVVAEEIGDKSQIASAWNNMGVVYLYQGNYRPALDYLQKGLAVRESMRDKPSIAGSLNNIAIVYDFQGNYPQALEYYRRSLKLQEEIGDRAHAANVLNNIGDQRLLGSYDLALEYNKKSLAVAEEIGDQPLMARALGNIGHQYQGKGNYDQALEYILKSLTLAEEIGDREVAANEQKHAANAYYLKGDYQKSLDYAEQAIDSATKIGSRQSLWTALDAKGQALFALNRSEEARIAFDQAITTIEDWRSLVGGGELEEQTLFSEKIDVYHQMIRLLLSQNETEIALQYAERAKARVLLDVLRSGRVNIYKAMTPQERLQEQTWVKQLVSLNNKIQQEKSNDQPDQSQLADLDKQLQTARLSFESFRNDLYAAHPELKIQRGESEPVASQELANLVPDEQSILLEYVVTEERTFVFALTRQNNSQEVKTTAYTIAINENDLTKRIEDFRALIANRDARFRNPSIELYGLLLDPAAKEFYGKTKVIIVPDAALWELPFQALTSTRHRFLLEDFNVSYAPSLTVLREMRNPRPEKPETNTLHLFALGNPTLNQQTKQQVHLVYRDETLAPLPEAEIEVKKLNELYGPESSKVYIGDTAQEGLVKSETETFNVFHIATHAVIDDASPMYSQVLLAHPEDSQEDGLLEAWEIMNLRLKADLVVLSACETALGKVRKGEGMIGLMWAFFVTGSSTEVVSQWKVASASTTDLMLSFHRKLRANIPKAEALRQAELELSHKSKYRHPFYWASFVLVGDGS